MTVSLVGRHAERAILSSMMEGNNPELVAILGRRRVGKTFLVHQHCASQIVFECSGSIETSTQLQLANFAERLQQHFKLKFLQPPATWQQAFLLLEEGLSTLASSQKKQVVFFDEFPWLDTHRSGFIAAFSYWWNMYGVRRANLMVIICGSATSWMIQRVMKSKGGLHNRVTQRLHLAPFTLAETEEYLRMKRIKLTRYQVAQLYMVMGGIPHYLNAVQPGQSVEQIINAACFTKNGQLYDEFDNLYQALFAQPDKHILIVKLLAAKHTGLTRGDMVAGAKAIQSGGGLTKALEELTECGFVYKLYPFDKKKKDAVYRLADEFTLFYFRFMARHATEPKDWNKLIPTQAFTQWAGYAFENICLRHLPAIKQALGIAGVYTEVSSWRWAGGEGIGGAQIDLLIDRADQCINLCEMKFAAAPFALTRKYADELQHKEQAFRTRTGTRKAIFITIVAPNGVVDNEYKTQRVTSQVSLDNLFG